MSLPVLVINRAIDTDRLKTFQASATAHGIQPTRIDAYDVHRPDFAFGLFAEMIGPNFWGPDQTRCDWLFPQPSAGLAMADRFRC